jgi:hypothetical protein
MTNSQLSLKEQSKENREHPNNSWKFSMRDSEEESVHVKNARGLGGRLKMLLSPKSKKPSQLKIRVSAKDAANPLRRVDAAKIRLMMVELQDIQNSYRAGTSPYRWIDDCLSNLDGAACAIAKLED